MHENEAWECVLNTSHTPKQWKKVCTCNWWLRVCPLSKSVVIRHAKTCFKKTACGNVSRALRLVSGPAINFEATGHCCNKGLCCKSACTCRAYHQTQIPTIHPCLCKPTTPALRSMGTLVSVETSHSSSQISGNSSPAIRPWTWPCPKHMNQWYLFCIKQMCVCVLWSVVPLLTTLHVTQQFFANLHHLMTKLLVSLSARVQNKRTKCVKKWTKKERNY